jgi:hypothetical protein
MKNNNSTSFIVFAGVIVLCVFTVVATINLLPRNNESNSYYVKVGDEMSAKIEALDIKNSKLIITTSGDATEYCVKSTKSTPDSNNICWKKIENNTASISIYQYKKYYIWIKDTNNKISSPMSINTRDKED